MRWWKAVTFELEILKLFKISDDCSLQLERRFFVPRIIRATLPRLLLSSRSLKNHQIGTYIRQARERQTNRLAMFNAIAFEYTEPDPT